MCRRFSIPGPPLGILEKSSLPSVFWPSQLNGQWSVETAERTSFATQSHRCSRFSFDLGGGVYTYFAPSKPGASTSLSRSMKKYCVQVSPQMFQPFARARAIGSVDSLHD